jgi:hypothetical protein
VAELKEHVNTVVWTAGIHERRVGKVEFKTNTFQIFSQLRAPMYERRISDAQSLRMPTVLLVGSYE